MTDDLPTPPFPDATATTRVREPDSPTAGGAPARRAAIIASLPASSITSIVTSAARPEASSASWIRLSNSGRAG